jgi:hypothetical protein
VKPLILRFEVMPTEFREPPWRRWGRCCSSGAEAARGVGEDCGEKERRASHLVGAVAERVPGSYVVRIHTARLPSVEARYPSTVDQGALASVLVLPKPGRTAGFAFAKAASQWAETAGRYPRSGGMPPVAGAPWVSAAVEGWARVLARHSRRPSRRRHSSGA